MQIQRKLKDNSTILVREATLSDANALNELAMTIFGAAQHIVTTVEDFVPMATQAAQEHRIQSYRDQDGSLLLVAEQVGKFVGTLDFRNGRFKRNKHVGVFGVSVHPNYQNKGIGRTLIQTLLDWAKAQPLIEKVKLEVFANNKNAIHLYKQLGFLQESEKGAEIKLENGDYVDIIEMYKMT